MKAMSHALLTVLLLQDEAPEKFGGELRPA